MKKEMLICVASDAKAGAKAATGNNNKFYYAELNGTTITIKYGRVGTAGTVQVKNGENERSFDKLISDKIKRGYVRTEIDLEADSKEIDGNKDVMMIALDQIQSDEHSKDLIKKLVKKNIHNITSNTKITFNVSTGIFRTPLGVVTKTGVNKALDILNKISDLVDENGLKSTTKEKQIRELSEEYYIIIPTTIANLKPLHAHLYNLKKVTDQYDICNALLQSIDLVESEKDKEIQKAKDEGKVEQIFDTKLTLLQDQKEFDRIVKYFEDSKNKQHGYRTSNAKIKRIFNVGIQKDDEAFRSDMSNQMELWHGTKICNLLSILKAGLFLPKQVANAQITGALFGSGIYFSSQSSKSMNYGDSMYWNNSNREDNKIYMFLAKVAMGNYQIPKGMRSGSPDKGYDSYWAKPGQSGILNDEMIVFDKKQIRLTHLLEIEVN